MSIPGFRIQVQRHAGIVLPFALDPPVFQQYSPQQLVLTGWAIHPRHAIDEVVIGRGEQTLAGVVPDQHRPGATAAHVSLPGADKPGFTLGLDNPLAGEYWLAVRGGNQPRQIFADLTLTPADLPQLFYMHIAKAGGSTVNRYFMQHFRASHSREHIESAPEWPKNPQALAGHAFLSGHISLRALDEKLDAERFKLVTVVREPFSHLVSHLAWIRRLAEKGEERRFNIHPQPVQVFARKLADCDFTSTRDVSELVANLAAEERILVDNCQVRYFAKVPGDWVGEPDLQEAKAATRRFAHIGLTRNLDGFFAAVAHDMGWPPPAAAGRVNVTGDFFGLDRLAPEVSALLKPLVRFDEALFDWIVSARHSS
jgi:hypothetical protein